MIANDLIKYIEKSFPPGAAWESDNIGLQIGSIKTQVKNIFLSLELNEKALDDAIGKNCNFIFTHHPLIFKPISKLDTQNDDKAKIIERAIKKDITVYSAHTNFDFSKGGVSFELAKKLKLRNVRFLRNYEGNQFKVAVFVPENSLDKVSEALFSAGGGVIGEYEQCSFRMTGKGTFRGSEISKPFSGKKNVFEKVDEIRIEVLADAWNLERVINSMLDAHPYEEPAYDIYILKNRNVNFGFGTIGELEESYSVNKFLMHVSKSLRTNFLRYCRGRNNRIKKVAVCGGSGSDLLDSAIAQKADAYITADVKYHTFQDAENKILFVDAGHYETEIHSLNVIKTKIERLIRDKNEKIRVFKFSGSTNPLRIFNKRGVN